MNQESISISIINAGFSVTCPEGIKVMTMGMLLIAL
jgi:hypothetical protein